MRKRTILGAFGSSDSESLSDREIIVISKKRKGIKPLKIPGEIVNEDTQDQPDDLDSDEKESITPGISDITDNAYDGLKYNERQSYKRGDILERSLFESENTSIGLSIMQKMGFKVGDTLGKNDSSYGDKLKVPIDVHTRLGREGIGSKPNPDTKRGFTYINVDLVNYREHLKKSFSLSKLTNLIQKLQKICFEQSGDYDKLMDAPEKFEVKHVNIYWKEYVMILKRKKFAKCNNQRILLFDDDENEDKDTDYVERELVSIEKSIEYINFKNLDPSEKLAELMRYSREVNHYCIFCGCFYDDQEDLQKNCPGIFEENHE